MFFTTVVSNEQIDPVTILFLSPVFFAVFSSCVNCFDCNPKLIIIIFPTTSKFQNDYNNSTLRFHNCRLISRSIDQQRLEMYHIYRILVKTLHNSLLICKISENSTIAFWKKVVSPHFLEYLEPIEYERRVSLNRQRRRTKVSFCTRLLSEHFNPSCCMMTDNIFMWIFFFR